MKNTKLSLVIHSYKRLQRISRQLNNLACQECNIGLTERQKIKERKLIKDAKVLAREGLGMYLYYQGDPRGCALYVSDTKKDGSNYTDGIAIF